MTPQEISILVSVVGFIASVASAAFVAGYRWGGVKIRLDLLEKQIETMATKEQMSGIKEDVAEIKGMFRMIPRSESGKIDAN